MTTSLESVSSMKPHRDLNINQRSDEASACETIPGKRAFVFG